MSGDKKISELPASTVPLTGAELVPIDQSGVTARVTIANLTAGRAVAAKSQTLTSYFNAARGTIAMHATTMDLWAKPNTIDGTGSSVTITAIADAPQAGAIRVLYPIAGSIITNGATFAVDGGTNQTAAAGDEWEFEAVTTSTYKVHITKADGTAVVYSSGGISNIVIATASTTLSTTPSIVKCNPTSYGWKINFTDATTWTVGSDKYIIDNSAGAYPMMAMDYTGALRAFVNPGVVSPVSLTSIATSAGGWAVEGGEKVGASAQLLSTKFASIQSVVALDSDHDFILSYDGSASYGTVYKKSTNTWGNPTLIRSAAVDANQRAIKSATDQILIVSCDGTTGAEFVTLTITSDVVVTPNTPVPITLSANISSFADGCGLIQVGTSFITSYTVATPAAQIREITVSGTTPAISAATSLDGTAGGLIVAGDSTHVIAVSTATTHLYTKPYTIGGLSAGTGTDTNSGTMILNRLAVTGGGRWWCIYNDGGSTVNGAVISLSATTTTISIATGFSSSTLQDAIIVGTTKLLMLNAATTNNGNIITDSAGTASAGTAITINGETTRRCIYAIGTSVFVQSGTSNYFISAIDCSGSSPVLSQTYYLGSNTNVETFSSANSVLSRSADACYGATFAQTLIRQSGTESFSVSVNGGLPQIQLPFAIDYGSTTGGSTFSMYRGSADSSRWGAISTKIVRYECVA